MSRLIESLLEYAVQEIGTLQLFRMASRLLCPFDRS